MPEDRTFQTTVDAFLGGKLMIEQPVNGFRTGGDTVMLAASIDAGAGERLLDIGCGPGTAGLCVAARSAEVEIVGMEVQPEMAGLARKNVASNRLEARMTIVEGDVSARAGQLDDQLAPDSFDQVFANPPYMKAGSAQAAPNQSKATARMEQGTCLSDWIDFALRVVKPKGTLTFVFSADRMDELISLLYGRAGELIIFPLWTRDNEPAKRVIIRARKGVRGPSKMAHGLVIHKDAGRYSAGRYSDCAEDILRNGAGLCLLHLAK